jgi:Ca2+-binding EF-hand superfamily protein
MRGTPIPILALVVAFGFATPAHHAAATPRQGGDGQAIGVPESRVAASRIVTLGARRVAIADPDMDGIVSPAEAGRYYETRFVLMDRDRDGRLSEPEFSRAGTSRSLQAVDSFSNARPFSFGEVDVDRSGALTAEEFQRTARRAWAIGVDRVAARRSLFAAADVNGDGALSKQELTEAGSRHFAGSDANGDGRVTISEFYAGARF